MECDSKVLVTHTNTDDISDQYTIDHRKALETLTKAMSENARVDWFTTTVDMYGNAVNINSVIVWHSPCGHTEYYWHSA